LIKRGNFSYSGLMGVWHLDALESETWNAAINTLLLQDLKILEQLVFKISINKLIYLLSQIP